MGETAELLARQSGITREESDCFALESQKKTKGAVDGGYFSREIAPVTVTIKGKQVVVSQDEHPRPDSTLEGLRKMPVVFGEVDGKPSTIVTAGSASGITDGGAAVVLTSAERAREKGLKPRARIIGWASAGVDPRIMGIGPVPAMRKLFARTGLTIDDFDLVEINEAFAAQVLACLKEIPVSADRLNVNGGAIALGHPIGATGTRIMVTLLHELERRNARRGLATLCISGGMGMAVAIERI
jgi:acetyl-CoA acetyltransferase family protein